MTCKPGDLAYLVGGVPNENTGRIFEVLRVNVITPEFGLVWIVRAYSPIRTFNIEGVETGFKSEMDCPDDWLRPINGVPVSDEIVDEIPTCNSFN